MYTLVNDNGTISPEQQGTNRTPTASYLVCSQVTEPYREGEGTKVASVGGGRRDGGFETSSVILPENRL